MPLITWELWLARDIVTDSPLPWQKSQAKLTLLSGSSGNRWSFSSDWYTATFRPNKSGKSPGWPEGQPRLRRIRYPVVKKRTKKPKQRLEKSA